MSRWYELLQINALFFGLNTLTVTNGFILPLLVQQIVGVTQQGEYFGRVRLWSLMASILAQSLMGVLSDGSHLRWGRRRPFILAGTLGTPAFLLMITSSPVMRGESSFEILLLLLILLQVAYNTACAGANGLIPDLVDVSQRGIASGVKALLEVPLPLLFVAFFVSPLISRGDFQPALYIGMAILLLTSLITLTVKEPVPEAHTSAIKIEPLLRLFLMTAFFAAVILLLGALVQLVARWPVEPTVWLQPVVVGFIGLFSIALALLAGAWISLRIGLGKAALQGNPSYRWWILHRLTFLAAIFNMGVFSVYFIQTRLGIKGELAAGPGALFLALLGILLAITTLPGGWLADRYGKKRLAILGCLIAALGTIILLSSTHLAVVILGGGLIGIGAGIVYAASWALGTGLIPEGQAGKYLGIQNLAAAGAGAVGAYLGGPIADYFGLYFTHLPGLGYLVLYAMFGVLFLLSAAALLRVRSD